MARDVTLAVQGGRHLVAQAPTGIGKTAAALAPAIQAALAQDRTVLFLTSRQSQHRIAVETVRAIRDRRGAPVALVDLVAKRDMCLRKEAQDMHPARFSDFCADETRRRSCMYLGDVDEATLARVREGVLHVEELMHVSRQATLCPHLVAMEAAARAHVVVADYNHLVSDIRERSLERLGLRLEQVIVVVDEAHNLPDRIRQNHRHRIGPWLLDRVEAEAREHKQRDVQADVAALRRVLGSLAERAEKDGRAEEAKLGDGRRRIARLQAGDLHAAFEQARAGLGLHRTLEDAAKDLAPLAAKVRRGADEGAASEELARALEDWGRFRDAALRYLEWQDGSVELHVRLLDPAVAVRSVFARVHAAVLMSGTLQPPEMFRDTLGLEPARTTVRTYASPFPPENRLTVIQRGVTTRFTERKEALWRTIAGGVGALCAAAAGNVAVFAPSYQTLRAVRDHLDVEKEVIEEEPGMGKAERDAVLDRLRGARRRGGALLLGVMGGSFAEGVDYRDNLLSAVVVVGLPLPPPELEVEATVAHLESRFPGRGRLYGLVQPAMQRAMQAAGRGIRSADDRCAVVLFDERYQQHPYRGFLPDAAVSDDAVAVASRFLAAHGL